MSGTFKDSAIVFIAVLCLAGLGFYLAWGSSLAPLPMGGSSTTPPEYYDKAVPMWHVMTLVFGVPAALLVSFLYALVVSVANRS